MLFFCDSIWKNIFCGDCNMYTKQPWIIELKFLIFLIKITTQKLLNPLFLFFSVKIWLELTFLDIKVLILSAVDENIIGAPKIHNYFWNPSKMLNFLILRKQYWTFLYCSPISYHSSNFAIAKVFAPNFFAYFFVSILCILIFSIDLRIDIALVNIANIFQL